MYFENLTIKNFLSVGEATLGLHNKGLVLIEGRNIDDPSAKSNGAGKSSIVDALCWVLYGKTARGVSTDAVVNRKAKKNCEVSVEVIDDGKKYTIARYRKHEEQGNNLSVQCGDQSLTKGTIAETQEVVEQLIGCNHNVFVATVYAGQDAMPDLPAMTDKQLKELIETVIGVERLTVAYQTAQRQRGVAENVLFQKQAEVEKHERALALAKSLESSIKENRRQHIEVCELRLKEAEAKLAESEALLRTLTAKSAMLQAKKAGFEQKLQTLQADMNAVDSAKERLNELTRDKEIAQNESFVAMHKAKAKKADCEKIAHSIKTLDSKVGTKCSECGKTYRVEDLSEAKTALMKQLSEGVAEFNTLNESYKSLEKVAESCRLACEDFQSKMPDTSALMSEWGEISRSIRKIDTELNSFESQKMMVDQSKSAIDGIKNEMNGANPYDEPLDACTRQQFDISELLNIARQDVQKAEKELAVMQSVENVLGPKGIRQHVLDAVTPVLNDRTARYLNILSDGKLSAIWTTLTQNKKGEVREKFNIEVNNSVGGGSFESLSGGEKRKVRVACCLALQELVSSRATKPIELFIADEVDHALDESGVERLIGVLNEKAQVCKSLFVISHNPLRNWIDNAITVEKRNGQTTII